jgi:PAS domain S-box-containing protein
MTVLDGVEGRVQRVTEYKWSILLVGAALVGQSVLIVTLMIQRTRRMRVERALRESEERFRLMADTVPVLVWRADTANLCDFVNRPWLEFTGRTMEQESGNGWTEGVWPADLDRCLSTCVAALNARQSFRMEFRLRRADGAYRWVLDTGVPRYGSDGSFAGYIGSCLDITDRKDSEDALRDSQQRYALATAAGAVGVWDWNLETNDLYVDPTLKSILGFEDAEIANRLDWTSLEHPDDAMAVVAQVQRCIDGDADAYEVAHRMVHKDGSLRWFLERGSLIRRADGTPLRLVGTDMDISERKRGEEAMRENEAVLQASHREIEDLAGRLIASQEVERARIARDLHDDLSQQLAALSIALSSVKRRVAELPGAGDLQDHVSSIQQRTITLAENIRHLSHDLHPSVIAHAGLVPALAAYCTELQRSHTVAVTFSAEGELQSIAADVALCLYRVAQEGLRNVVTHADARHAQVRLLRTGDRAELTIIDDGRGFDTVQTGKSIKGLGLVSINERVRLAGGTFSIVTELNKGTRVRVQVPMSRLPTNAAADVSDPY